MQQDPLSNRQIKANKLTLMSHVARSTISRFTYPTRQQRVGLREYCSTRSCACEQVDMLIVVIDPLLH
eukprot:scaffold10744_cov162-Skeletonema_marinoi.AAC.6